MCPAGCNASRLCLSDFSIRQVSGSRQLFHQADHLKRSILTAALLCLLLSPLARADAYRVITEEWAPYNYRENGRLTGMATEIVRAIMENTRHHGRRRTPILVMCYTNHALDQFLEGIHKFCGRIVRIGARSKSRKTTPCGLQFYRRAVRLH